MKHRIFTILAAGSAVLGVALVVVGVVSYLVPDYLFLDIGQVQIDYVDNGIWYPRNIDRQRRDTRVGVDGGHLVLHSPSDWPPIVTKEFLGISWTAGGDSWIRVSLAYPIVLTAILPALGLVLWWCRRQHPPGHCRRCGYDLRASKDQCPECGEAIVAGGTAGP